MTRTALVLSPHLDDAAFSCGGLMAQLADEGWRLCLATVFTRSIHPAAGFALACQLDKGLPADVDYMALRREEDRVAAALLGVSDLRWLDLPEAPHRGYGSAEALFGPILDDDGVLPEVAAHVAALIDDVRPDLVLGPQGLGAAGKEAHVDHRQVIRAMTRVAPGAPLAFYRDTPYALRNPGAQSYVAISGLHAVTLGIASGLERKIAAACAYASQIGFQFGGREAAGRLLRAFAIDEGAGRAAERFLSSATVLHG